jgi:hypothetical protein
MFRLPGSGEAECRKLLGHYDVPFSGRELSIDDAAELAVARTNGLEEAGEPVGHAAQGADADPR